ncbi:hypothetical protein McanMca71_002024 [Microsporum canis]
MAPSRRRRSSPEAEPIVPTEPPLRGRQMYQPDGPSSVRRDREPRMSLMAIRHPNYYARNPQQEAYFGENRPSLLIRPDLIDKMDTVSELYHHEGPYDAAARERNIFPDQAPMQALQYSTAEALRATPHDMIIDSIRERRPLDGVATLPPGSRDMSGRVLNYKEGANMMVEDRGNFQRHPGAKFENGDPPMDPYYNQEDIEKRRLERKRARSCERSEPEDIKPKRPLLSRWKKAFL